MPISRTGRNSINRFLMKLFTSNMQLQTIQFCRLQFDFKLPSEQIGYRCKKCSSSEFVSINLAIFRVLLAPTF